MWVEHIISEAYTTLTAFFRITAKKGASHQHHHHSVM